MHTFDGFCSCIEFIIILSSSLFQRGKVPQTDMEQTFPGMSGDFTSENFSATWYLIENHSGTGYVLPQYDCGDILNMLHVP